MSWRAVKVEWTKKAIKDVRDLNQSVVGAIFAAVEKYAATGVGDVKALQGLAGYRLRVGGWRIFFDLKNGEVRIMSITRVSKRGDAY